MKCVQHPTLKEVANYLNFNEPRISPENIQECPFPSETAKVRTNTYMFASWGHHPQLQLGSHSEPFSTTIFIDWL
jgi:hypothetical protein